MDRKLTRLERRIYNAGERLIPGVTHDLAEVVRHRSSYAFFRRVIELDLQGSRRSEREIEIVDLGCGVGHGCYALSEIQGSSVVGVENSPECLRYADDRYSRGNVAYVCADLVDYIPAMPEVDYAVSRGVFEHVPDGLRLAFLVKRRCRLMFDVPYDEPESRNPHHVLHGIREDDLSGFPGVELFFQDLEGVIYDAQHKPPSPNMILCVSSHLALPDVASRIRFPVPAWRPGQDSDPDDAGSATTQGASLFGRWAQWTRGSGKPRSRHCIRTGEDAGPDKQT
jgi:SAM-dependent methyltransferase